MNPVEQEIFIEVPGGKVFVKHWQPAKLLDPVPVILFHDSLGSVNHQSALTCLRFVS